MAVYEDDEGLLWERGRNSEDGLLRAGAFGDLAKKLEVLIISGVSSWYAAGSQIPLQALNH